MATTINTKAEMQQPVYNLDANGAIVTGIVTDIKADDGPNGIVVTNTISRAAGTTDEVTDDLIYLSAQDCANAAGAALTAKLLTDFANSQLAATQPAAAPDATPAPAVPAS